MDSVLSLHRTPDAGFDRPFEMLAACHERVERMLRLLERLALHLPGQGADRQAQDAARDLMRYFDHAAVQHHLDEELHVLPLLRQAGRVELAERLHDDHGRMARAWEGLRVELVSVAQGQRVEEDSRFTQRAADFTALYRAHVAIEEAEAYPLAAASADETLQARMGREMATRRGLP